MQKLTDIEGQLKAAQQKIDRLDDPTVGLTALHGELVQSRLKILEKIEGASPGCARRTGRFAGARTG
ncbi:hypothetical protein QWJ26_08665 [Streptomyces sp. CSDS2]|uniref:hypothetical protein n=1 Tax=Streptomyces sp. CSDS2 TaxID=3055051 RepID=UPI0025B1399C|nr:hypothetical protein [Streptomyces sp. CSDS2]MDN3259879.1 hypothetical protein [Streptomyces sp. CSDS2]